MDWRERITIEPGKRGGRPCIRGLRITVYDVLDEQEQIERLEADPSRPFVVLVYRHFRAPSRPRRPQWSASISRGSPSVGFEIGACCTGMR
jgi:hypothetical protein